MMGGISAMLKWVCPEIDMFSGLHGLVFSVVQAHLAVRGQD